MQPIGRFIEHAPSNSPVHADAQKHVETLLNGYRQSALLYAAAKLKLPDILAQAPGTSDDLARRLQVNAAALQRLLRGLVVLGICLEQDNGEFTLGPSGTALRSDLAGSRHALALLIGEEYVAAWFHLPHSVRTGGPAFDHAFGMTPWQHRQQSPELNHCFNQWLGDATASVTPAILEAYDFSPFATIADVGGGQSSLLAAILRKHPKTHGILFDQPHVAPMARSVLNATGVIDRCRIVEGDFFEAVPEGADLLILKSILHDWMDEKALAILNNCRTAMCPGRKLLLVERVMPQRAADDAGTVMLDLHMLAVTGGKERTLGEFQTLLSAAGLEFTSVTPLRSGHSLIEARRT